MYRSCYEQSSGTSRLKLSSCLAEPAQPVLRSRTTVSVAKAQNRSVPPVYASVCCLSETFVTLNYKGSWLWFYYPYLMVRLLNLIIIEPCH